MSVDGFDSVDTVVEPMPLGSEPCTQLRADWAFLQPVIQAYGLLLQVVLKRNVGYETLIDIEPSHSNALASLQRDHRTRHSERLHDLQKPIGDECHCAGGKKSKHT